MFWQVHSFPDCTHHVFLSHCAENHDTLVRPVYDGLLPGGITPWLDREDYFYGRDSRTALKDGILSARHTVFFITHELLATGRGWCVLELAFAEILQANLSWNGGLIANVVLPLFFVPQNDPLLPRTVWQAIRDRGCFHDPATDGDPVAWARQEVLRFLRDEQRLAINMLTVASQDKMFTKHLRSRMGLYNRVTRVDPAPVL